MKYRSDIVVESMPEVRLRPLTPDIYKELFEICFDDEIMSFLGISSVEELETEKEKFKQGIVTHKLSFVYFQILLKGEIIGDCGFHTWYVKHNRAEIGYAIKIESHRNQGIMSSVMPVMLQYGFDNMKLHRVEALVGKDNIASQKLLLNNGFEKEGILREHYLVNGNYEDSVIYGLIRATEPAR